jgi:hypothetical protein
LLPPKTRPSIHNQKRSSERMNEIFCDVNSRNARMNQWQGRWPESIKMRFDCGIRCRNQPIKRGHDKGLGEISIVGQGGQTAHRQDNNHERPLQSSNGSHAPTLPMCTAECKTVDVAGARAIAAGRPSIQRTAAMTIAYNLVAFINLAPASVTRLMSV